MMEMMLAESLAGIDNGTFLHIMLAVAITLLVLDIFINTEFLSWVALVVFAAWGTWLVGAPWQWSVLVFLGFLALACTLYYTLWVQCVRRVFMGWVLRNAPRESTEQIGGTPATVLGEGDNLCVRWEDHVIAIAAADKAGLVPGERVIIDAVQGGVAHVHKIEG